MTPEVSNGHSTDDRTMRVLDQMIELLETERQALLTGDAGAVTNLASDKEFLARSLNEVAQQLNLESATDRQIVTLVRKVSKLTESNHALLQQMYQHYQGMLELLLKVTGHGSTYDKHGSVDIDYGPRSHAQFTA